MYRINITPPGKKAKPRVEFARTSEELARIVGQAWKQNQHNKVRVYNEDEKSYAGLRTQYEAQESRRHKA